MAAATLRQAIVEFLDSASSTERQVTHGSCGTKISHQKTTFFFHGQSWVVELPICPACNPSPGLITHNG
jgi:hypothetical protein